MDETATTTKAYTGRLQPRERSARPIDGRVDIGHVHLKTADLGTHLRLLRRHPRLRRRLPDGRRALPVGGRLPPRPRLQHVDLRRGHAASSRNDRPLPRRRPLPHPRGAGRRAEAPRRRRLAAQRRQRPRDARGAVSPRPRRQRSRALLGPPRRGVADRRGRPSRLLRGRTRPEPDGPGTARARLRRACFVRRLSHPHGMMRGAAPRVSVCRYGRERAGALRTAG